MVNDLRSEIEGHVAQVGDISRLVGNASQGMKLLREKEYLNKTDAGFKSFLQMKKAGMSKDQLQEEKLTSLDERSLVKSAKEYG